MPRNRTYRPDVVDAKILAILADKGRTPVSDLAERVGMSAPSVTERIRRLEAAGIIRAFTIAVDAKALGYTLEAIVRVKPRPGQLHQVERLIQREPRFTACDKITGDDCFVVRASLASIEDLDTLLKDLHERAETNTAIVKSSPIKGRIPPPVKAS
jgi:Lrp/AsnC family transcriptional regulator, leucine-responsive regulatory protein